MVMRLEVVRLHDFTLIETHMHQRSIDRSSFRVNSVRDIGRPHWKLMSWRSLLGGWGIPVEGLAAFVIADAFI